MGNSIVGMAAGQVHDIYDRHPNPAGNSDGLARLPSGQAYDPSLPALSFPGDENTQMGWRNQFALAGPCRRVGCYPTNAPWYDGVGTEDSCPWWCLSPTVMQTCEIARAAAVGIYLG